MQTFFFFFLLNDPQWIQLLMIMLFSTIQSTTKLFFFNILTTITNYILVRLQFFTQSIINIMSLTNISVVPDYVQVSHWVGVKIIDTLVLMSLSPVRPKKSKWKLISQVWYSMVFRYNFKNISILFFRWTKGISRRKDHRSGHCLSQQSLFYTRIRNPVKMLKRPNYLPIVSDFVGKY
jgi:hypothetical protein